MTSDAEIIDGLRQELTETIQALEQLAEILRVVYADNLEVDILSNIEELFKRLKLDL